MDCTLYAELLANIRQISLAASLPSPCDASTQVALSADRSTVELSHGSSNCSLTLPAKVALGGALLPIQDKQKGTAALSWRLPLDTSSLSSPRQANADHTPWSATDLDPSSGVACRQCDTNVVPAGAVTAWKDLPSENWAEMMEFWHCHKPDHHHNHDGEAGKADEESLAARGYGAASTISAQQGVGFVDLTTLLFAETDCSNVTFSMSTHDQGAADRQSLALVDTATQTRNLNAFCSSCHAQLGFFNFRASAVTLLKWQISCKSSSRAAPSVPECLAATLISTIARSGSAKSLIIPIPETIQAGQVKGDIQDAIHIWVLNSSIVYSSNAAPHPIPAIKLLFRSVSLEEADKMLSTITCDSQEINLPAQAMGEVLRHLEESRGLLPPAERTFKDWKVGLLTKWEREV